MKFSDIEQLRVLAAVTGLVLVVVWFGLFIGGRGGNETVAMLATAVAGFELFFFSQDMTKRWRRRRG